MAYGIIRNLAKKETFADIERRILGYNVPSESTLQNYIGTDGKFHQVVNRINLGTFACTYDTSTRRFISDNTYSDCQNASERRQTSAYSDKYTIKSSDETYNENWNMTAYFVHTLLYVHDRSYTTVTSFHNANSGKYLYYKLATDILHTI